MGRKESNHTKKQVREHCTLDPAWVLTMAGADWLWSADCTGSTPGTEVIKLVLCSAQLSIMPIMLMNVKMPTIVGILTFISMINKASESLYFFSILVFMSSSNFVLRWDEYEKSFITSRPEQKSPVVKFHHYLFCLI